MLQSCSLPVWCIGVATKLSNLVAKSTLVRDVPQLAYVSESLLLKDRVKQETKIDNVDG
jgi:hypothetical protein